MKGREKERVQSFIPLALICDREGGREVTGKKICDNMEKRGKEKKVRKGQAADR